MRRYLSPMSRAIAVVAFLCLLSGAAQAERLPVPNAGFEDALAGSTAPRDWTVGIGGGAKATVAVDDTVAHSGRRSLRITNLSPLQAFVYGMASSPLIPVSPLTTYDLTVWVRGEKASGCYVGAAFDTRAEERRALPAGTFPWRRVTLRMTTPAACRGFRITVACDDVTGGVWVDDIAVQRAPVRLAEIAERRVPRPYAGVWPRTPGPVATHLAVLDLQGRPIEESRVATALQGLANRRGARVYLLHTTNPAGMDADWLRYMQAKGHTGVEERLPDLQTLVRRFRSDLRGAIVPDPAVPGTLNVAFMLSGLLRGVPASPELASRLGLPVIADLRGRWRRSVEGYRWVWRRYGSRMNPHVLAWIYPTAGFPGSRDYMVQHNVPQFWVSKDADNEPASDPDAEMAFLHELLAATPGCVPVMGWPAYADTKGLSEYEGVRLLAQYGKFVPGTDFCTNLSVHTAVRIANQRLPQPPKGDGPPDPGRLYVALNIMDSGDALWYWQLWQRTIWADPARGQVPMGWAINPTLADAMPLVLEWYREHATPNDCFLAFGGIGYTNLASFAERFRAADRERVWADCIALSRDYCRRLGLDGIELYNGGWGQPTPPPGGTFERFTKGIPGLRYILADLGRHDSVNAGNASTMLDGVAVFHTLTRFRVWTSSDETSKRRMDESNAWLLEEMRQNAPTTRPGFMSGMAISWYTKPSWLVDLRSKLPADWQMVTPAELARLYRLSATRR